MRAVLEHVRGALRAITSLAQEGVAPIRFGERMFEIATLARASRRQIDRALAGDTASLPSSIPPPAPSSPATEADVVEHYAHVAADALSSRDAAEMTLASVRAAVKVLLEEIDDHGIRDVDILRASATLHGILWPAGQEVRRA